MQTNTHVCVYLHGFTCISYFFWIYTLSKTIHRWSMMINMYTSNTPFNHRTLSRGPRDQFCGGRGSVKSGSRLQGFSFCFCWAIPPQKHNNTICEEILFLQSSASFQKKTNEGGWLGIPHCQVVHQFFLRLLDESRSYCRHAAAARISICKQWAHVCVCVCIYIYII